MKTECDEQPCPHRYNNKPRLWILQCFWKEDDPTTHVMQEQVLATEECWPKHNQHLTSNSPKPEFTAFFAALTASATNTPQVPTLELSEAGPSTAAPPLHVGRSSRLHTCSQTSTVPVQTVPKANPTPTSILAPTPL